VERPTLVVTDLDGTLWHTEESVHQRTVAALHRLRDADVPLLVATGRRTTSTRAGLSRIGVTPPAVVLNGALGIELSTGRRFHRAPFTTAAAAAVLGVFHGAGLEPCVYVDHPDVETFLGTRPSTNPSHRARLAASGCAVADLVEVCATQPVLAFGIIGVAHEALAPAADGLAGLAEAHLDRSLDHPGTSSLTVAPLRQSKWDGVVAFCGAVGLDPSRVVALGDGNNDLELLANAGRSLVPRAAHPDALALADVIIDDPRDGGWAAVLDHLG
jgi:hydroxymethylpyrimidine pyrophosphatase-like HAD family hydrolase